MIQSYPRAWLTWGLTLIAGVITALVTGDGVISTAQWLMLPVLLIGVMGLSRPRQPDAVLYQPRSLATRLLKWLSAPQIEAAILLWMGWFLLAQPEQTSAYHLTGLTMTSYVPGGLFLLLGWFLVVRLPTPLEYVLVTGSRLLYTLLVAVDLWQMNGPLIIVGIYLGGLLHGVVAMLVQWTLREVAAEVTTVQTELDALRTRMKGGAHVGAD